jgi:hypothetical protein
MITEVILPSLFIIGLYFLLGKVIYVVCTLPFIRFVVGSFFIWLLIEAISDTSTDIQSLYFIIGVSLQFIIAFFRYTQSHVFTAHKTSLHKTMVFLIKPISLLLNGGAKVSKYAISVVDGTTSAKQQLARERAEFENQKAWFEAREQEQQQEWENIQKAWEELIREREQFEQQKSGNANNHRQDYTNHQGYQKSKAKSHQQKQSQNKANTGRYFSEFAKFDLENFANNNPYDVLNIKTTATRKEILMAWKKLMVQFHPDKFNHENNLDKLKEANNIATLLNWAKARLT